MGGDAEGIEQNLDVGANYYKYNTMREILEYTEKGISLLDYVGIGTPGHRGLCLTMVEAMFAAVEGGLLRKGCSEIAS